MITFPLLFAFLPCNVVMDYNTGMKMNKIALFVTDLATMVGFYRDVMEMKTDWDGVSKNAEMTSDGIELIFYPRPDFEHMIHTSLTYPKQVNGSFSLCFDVITFGEVDKKYAQLVSRGAKPLFPPTTEAWGQRTSYLVDPEDNLIELSSFCEIAAAYETERLSMRPFHLRDAEAVFSYASDEETVRYLTWPAYKRIEEAQYSLRHFLNHEGCYAITIQETNHLIGCIDLSFLSDQKATFGFVLHKKYWNQGYMSEALQGLIDYVFHSLPITEIEGLCEVDNGASARVMQKCGMRFTHIEKNATCNGKVADYAHYLLTRSQYLSQHDRNERN